MDAIFEDGLLRPLGPLSLMPQQRVRLTVRDLSVDSPRLVDPDDEWLERNQAHYAGQWVALDQGKLVSAGPEAHAVFETARKAGTVSPMLIHVPEDGEHPVAFWI